MFNEPVVAFDVAKLRTGLFASWSITLAITRRQLWNEEFTYVLRRKGVTNTKPGNAIALPRSTGMKSDCRLHVGVAAAGVLNLRHHLLQPCIFGMGGEQPT
jgi:hypothetical protein